MAVDEKGRGRGELPIGVVLRRGRSLLEQAGGIKKMMMRSRICWRCEDQAFL